MVSCQPCSDNGAQYVQEVIAPSGATSCSGPPDGCDQSATKGKTRDQFVISKPDFLKDESWDLVAFLTPYYVQQLVVVAFPSTVSPTQVRTYLRYFLNSVPADVWMEKQLPTWHNPADYTIYDDSGAAVSGVPAMGVGWHCPRLLRNLFPDFGKSPRFIELVREARRWGRYLTITPVANATQFKGRIASASLQFNSALNPFSFASLGGVAGPDALPPAITTPAGFVSLTLSLQRSTTKIYFYDGVRWHNTPFTTTPHVFTLTTYYGFSIWNTTGTGIVVESQIQVTFQITLQAGGLTASVLMLGAGGAVVNNFTGNMSPGIPLSNQTLRKREFDTPSAAVSNELARYSITPEFSFEALLQADEKSYVNNWIEGAHSRQAYGKDHLDFVSTREWRPLIRSANNVDTVHIEALAVKRDLVDLSGKWQIDYATNLDPASSAAIVYGTHYQFCCETSSEFMLFKREVPEKDEGAIEMAQVLQSALPHTYPAKFNDGGILPLILSRVKSVGSAGLVGVARSIVSELLGGIREIGTADRVIGYPNMSTMYGNNAVALYKNGNGSNGNGKKKKNGNGVIPSIFSRTMNI